MTPLPPHVISDARATRVPLIVASLLLWSGALHAQADEFTIPPSSILPNYDRVSVGQREALEGGAYVARTDDALANWYNPAGLVSSEKTAINASSNAYELTKTTLTGIGEKSSGTRFSPIGGFFGVVVGAPIAKSPRWRLGFGYTKPVAWSPSTLDGAFNLPAGGGTEAFDYTTSASFGTIIPSLNAGYRLSPTIRVGAGVGYGVTELTQNQTITDRLILPTGVTTAIRVFSTDGSVQHLLAHRRRAVGPRARLHGWVRCSPPRSPDRRGQQDQVLPDRVPGGRPRERSLVPGLRRQVRL